VDLIHVAPADALPSIMRDGLVPQVPRLVHHRRAFKGFRLPRRVLYCWPARPEFKTSKYVRDSVYCKVWVWRGNAILDRAAPSYLNRLCGKAGAFQRRSPIIVDKAYVVLRFSVSKGWAAHPGYFFHDQTREGMSWPCWQDLDERYSHKDHPIVLVTETIPPERLRPAMVAWTISRWDGAAWSVDVHTSSLT